MGSSLMLSNLYNLKPLQRTYLTVAMSRVSRSFSLVVPWLEEPLQNYVATAYLLCRTLDNIEDCTQPLAWQKQRFAEFTHLLAEPELALDVLSSWEDEAWPGLSADEMELMTLEGGLPLWLIYSTFPQRTRSIIENWIRLMAKGMELALDPAQRSHTVLHENVRILTSVAAYNEYCYSVAGTVGGLGTELVIEHYGLSGEVTESLLTGSEACGRALQKTNILKDFVEDLERCICYLPNEWLREIEHAPLRLAGAPVEWIHAVIGDILDELRNATAYVLDVPIQASGYRISCLMCLFPAYQTVLQAARCQAELFTANHQIKIAREIMFHCIDRAVSLAPNDEAIRCYTNQIEEATLNALQQEALTS
jgi:farnesyl-diphosphate farnesyltransferase